MEEGAVPPAGAGQCPGCPAVPPAEPAPCWHCHSRAPSYLRAHRGQQPDLGAKRERGGTARGPSACPARGRRGWERSG